MNELSFRRQTLPIGDDEIPLLVASKDGRPSTVFMSYEAFLDLAATLYTAIEALQAAGVDADTLQDDAGGAPGVRDDGRSLRLVV